MPLSEWFRRTTKPGPQAGAAKKHIPEGLWAKCPGCQQIIYHKELDANLKVCPACGFHHRISAQRRAEIILDDGKLDEIDVGMTSLDPLGFKAEKAYPDTVVRAQQKTGAMEAVLSGTGLVGGHKTAVAIMDFAFIGGSMGSVVGEKIARLVELAIEMRLPLMIFSASGGARMQEGMYSLMQMAKTAAVLGKYQRLSKPFLSILTNPTMGGVTASFATLADVILAEPGALTGFAGPRVIEQTIRERLPKDFQTAEFMQAHGLVDVIVPRPKLRETLIDLLDHLDRSEEDGAQTHY